ncbi:MAG TPA: hypothetical protein VFR10_06690 [bacterium]|nr:hypothetical protein [bacterium]
MKLLQRILAPFIPPVLVDPDFGALLYMNIPRNPSKSYWECEWMFPPTKSRIAIALPGGPDGPAAASREFYLKLREDFPRVLELARPKVNQAILDWLNRPLNTDLWIDVKLSGFGIDDLEANPPDWEMSFETTGEKWISITIPFKGEVPGDPIIDT